MKNFLLIPPEKINNKKSPQLINRKRSFLVSVTNTTVHTFTFSGKIHVVKKIVFNNLIMYSNKHFIIHQSEWSSKEIQTHKRTENIDQLTDKKKKRIGNDKSIIHVSWQGFLFQKNTKINEEFCQSIYNLEEERLN